MSLITLRADARSETPPAAILAPPDDAARRRGVVAAVIGNTLEFYDFTTYAFFAVAIGRTFFPAGDAWVSLLASVATFGIGFVTRPIGGVVIGAYADRAGRKPAMMLTIALMAVGMLMLALTPGYATIGMAAPVLVVIGRLIQGFALGGEVGPSTAYLIESAPPGRRGLYASWQIASQGLATLCAGTVGVLLSLGLSPDQMQDWGWRIPFLLGLLIIPVGLYIRRAMPETAGESAGPAEATTGAVLVRLLRNHGRTLALVVPILLCGTVSTYVGNYMTTYAITTLKLPAGLSIAATAVVGACILVFAVLAGLLCDRYGRRRVMIVPRVLLLVAAYPAFLLMTRVPGPATLLGMSALLAALSAMSAAASLVAIPELLPRSVRSAGLSVAYAFVVTVFGGTTQLVVTWLIGVTGDPLAPAWYVIATSLVGVAAMLATPETKEAVLAA
ncbi:Predicted arabinose efflux permease, MFS family [Methylobacterium sp. ap11]|uniref:MFS transporter n=1 Tax=Methylobacterium sp. ap11 TaxID=1761799 RepID=UPI0008CF2A1A|nr:MFS transporter [Methylobacterium sp. ap11]SEP43685.1 Predicted arabinose efflux permease, MFS family [Methylobacterium sp. ap11]